MRSKSQEGVTGFHQQAAAEAQQKQAEPHLRLEREKQDKEFRKVHRRNLRGGGTQAARTQQLHQSGSGSSTGSSSALPTEEETPPGSNQRGAKERRLFAPPAADECRSSSSPSPSAGGAERLLTQNPDLQPGQALLDGRVDVTLPKVHSDGLGFHLVKLFCGRTNSSRQHLQLLFVQLQMLTQTRDRFSRFPNLGLDLTLLQNPSAFLPTAPPDLQVELWAGEPLPETFKTHKAPSGWRFRNQKQI